MSSATALRDMMRALEGFAAGPNSVLLAEYEKFRQQTPALAIAALAGLGSKYLAVGAPDTCGIIHCGSATEAIAECHTLLFGPLEFRVVGAELSGSTNCSAEEAFASDLVCMPENEEFSLAWIAEATHLNVHRNVSPSDSLNTLCDFASVTELSQSSEASSHGKLSEVICGQVSGRVGEEITLLLENR